MTESYYYSGTYEANAHGAAGTDRVNACANVWSLTAAAFGTFRCTLRYFDPDTVWRTRTSTRSTRLHNHMTKQNLNIFLFDTVSVVNLSPKGKQLELCCRKEATRCFVPVSS